MYTSITGLRNHQTMLDTVGNNIANVNTYGFKGSSVSFKTLLSQTMSGAGAPSPTLGGTNFQQVGLGMTTGAITQHFTQGGLQATSVATDLAIQGDGFFNVSDDAAGIAAGTPDLQYTRAGNFNWDAAGNLVTTNGSYVMGWTDDDPATAGFQLNKANPLVNMTVDPTKFSDIVVGNDGSITAIDQVVANPTYGQRVQVGQLALSRFSNPSGLQQIGNNSWDESLNSGVPIVDVPKGSGMGELSAGYLEMSNVDLATEFTEMIKAQRGFQANSRVITTSDEILQELVNLKR
jgi:flagellar hook protein FlgE